MSWPFLAPAPRGDVVPGPSPRFSVIVAAYQAADFIAEALTSAFGQTEPPYEVVVCDDGSTDDLAGALAPFADRIVLLRQENQGHSVAKNNAVDRATGDFVVVLDADDAWEPQRLEALGELAVTRPDLDVLTTDAWFSVDGSRRGQFYDGAMAFPTERQAEVIFDRCFVMPHAAVRRPRWLALGGFDPALRIASDWDFFVRAILGGSMIGAVGAPLATYRLRPGSLASSRAAALRERVTMLDKTAAAGVAPELRSPLAAARRRHERRALLAEADAALRDGGTHARRAAVRVALGRDMGLSTRAKASAAALLPGVARRRLLRGAPGHSTRPLVD